MDQRNNHRVSAGKGGDTCDTQDRDKSLRGEFVAEQDRSGTPANQLETRDAQLAELTARLASQQARESELLKGLKEREAEVTQLLALSEAQEEWARELAGLFAK